MIKNVAVLEMPAELRALVRLGVCPSVCLSACLSVRLPVRLSGCPFVCSRLLTTIRCGCDDDRKHLVKLAKATSCEHERVVYTWTGQEDTGVDWGYTMETPCQIAGLSSQQ